MKVLVIDCTRNITNDIDFGDPFKKQVYENYHVTYTVKNNIAHYIGEGDLSHQFKNIEIIRGLQASDALIQAQGVKPLHSLKNTDFLVEGETPASVEIR